MVSKKQGITDEWEMMKVINRDEGGKKLFCKSNRQ